MKKSEMKPSTQNILKELSSRFPDQNEFRTATIIETAKSLGYKYGDWKDIISSEFRIRRLLSASNRGEWKPFEMARI